MVTSIQEPMVTRPLIRYHGGKFLLAPWILHHFPAHRVYVEPFGGAASVLLQKQRSYAEVYNDLDGELVNLFQVVRDCGSVLKEKLILTPFARTEFRESYKPSNDPIEQARRTVIRAYMGFGSNAHNKPTGFRANSNRSGTTPAQDWRNYPDCLDSIVDRLRGVVIENRPAPEVMFHHDTDGTLHYADPPYVFETRNIGSDYRHEMTNDEHSYLSEVLKSLSGMVILSGYNCALYDKVYAGWVKVQRPALADGARARTEVLWLNESAWERYQDQKSQLEFEVSNEK